MSLDDLIGIACIVLIVALAVAATISGAYIRWVDRQRTEPSRYLDMLVSRDTYVAIGGAVIAALTIYGLLIFIDPKKYLPLPRPMGALISAAVLIAMFKGVISDAWQFRADRRMGPAKSPDPNVTER